MRRNTESLQPPWRLLLGLKLSEPSPPQTLVATSACDSTVPPCLTPLPMRVASPRMQHLPSQGLLVLTTSWDTSQVAVQHPRRAWCCWILRRSQSLSLDVRRGRQERERLNRCPKNLHWQDRSCAHGMTATIKRGGTAASLLQHVCQTRASHLRKICFSFCVCTTSPPSLLATQRTPFPCAPRNMAGIHPLRPSNPARFAQSGSTRPQISVLRTARSRIECIADYALRHGPDANSRASERESKWETARTRNARKNDDEAESR